MLRAILVPVVALSLCAAVALADDKNNDKKDAKGNRPVKATITKVDPAHHTVTVKMKDKDGKDMTKTFKLTEDVRYLDSTGKAIAVDVFRSGHYVLVVEREGKLKELRQDKDHDKSAVDKKSDKVPSNK